MQKNRSSLLITILIVISTLIVSGCTSDTTTLPDEIVIGYNSDQSAGATAAFGGWGAQGFQVAVDEINANGGILGKQVRGIVLDDENNETLSMENLEYLNSEGALAVIGPSTSAIAFSWLDYMQNNEIIMISHIAGASGITTKFEDRPRNYIFRIANQDIEQVRLFVAWGIEETNNGKFAIIHDSTAYGTQGIKDVNEVLAAWGKTPVYTASFDRGESVENLTNLLQSAKDAEADAIVLYALVDSNADILKALENVEDYDPVMIGTAANAVHMWTLAGELANKLVFTSPLKADYNDNSAELNQKIIDKFGQEPAILASAASGYDSVIAIKTAIEEAGTTDPSAVRDALETIDSLDAIMRVFDDPFSKENHELLKATDVFLARWTDGKIVFLDIDTSTLEIR